jgi:hypothetical protein
MPSVGEQMAIPGSLTNPALVAARFLLKPGRLPLVLTLRSARGFSCGGDRGNAGMELPNHALQPAAAPPRRFASAFRVLVFIESALRDRRRVFLVQKLAFRLSRYGFALGLQREDVFLLAHRRFKLRAPGARKVSRERTDLARCQERDGGDALKYAQKS